MVASTKSKIQSQYEAKQIIFTLSAISNWSAQKTGSTEELETKMASALKGFLGKNEIQKLIGDWDVVWGPVIYQDKHENDDIYRPANTMYVAKNRENEYVIAIAGTNRDSKYDWFVEDLSVENKVKWPHANSFPNKLDPQISEGTNIGLNHLTKDMRSSGKTIVQYLQDLTTNLDSGEIKITVTGHSLGGVLSATLALYLLDTQSDWDPQTKATIYAQPSAGPTPGDKDFSDYFQLKLGDKTERIWNTIDTYVHAWNQSDLDKVPNLYLPHIRPGLLVRWYVSRAKKLSGDNNYTQICPDTRGLPGEFHVDNTSDENADKFAKEVLNLLKQDRESEKYLSKLGENILVNLKTFRKFMDQVQYQHTKEYLSLLDMEDIKPYLRDFSQQEQEIEDFTKLIRKILSYQD